MHILSLFLHTCCYVEMTPRAIGWLLLLLLGRLNLTSIYIVSSAASARRRFFPLPIFHPACESLVKPQVIPPFHGDQITEPLMRELMRHDDGDPLLGVGAGFVLRVEQGCLSVCDQAPVFHGTGTKVRNGNQI